MFTLKYLKGALGNEDVYQDLGACDGEGFPNADWAGSLVGGKPTTAYCLCQW